MIVIGVDEAGRGPVLGPLVVGLLSIPKDDEYALPGEEDSFRCFTAARD